MANEVSDDVLERYRHVDPATVWTMLTRRLRGPITMEGVHSYNPGALLVGRARTVRYMPVRRLLDGSEPGFSGTETPEYQAMARCGPNDVLVCDQMRQTDGGAQIGDVKAYLLKQRHAAGMVLDGAIRDVKACQAYGLSVFAADSTLAAGHAVVDQYEENVVIGCGGVLVCPGDVIVACDDGVMVVPQQLAEQIIDQVEEYDAMEGYIKELLEQENVPPGTYYPPNDTFRERYRREKLGQS